MTTATTPLTKTFTLAAVLTITTGRLVSSMDDVYEILNHITGDNLFTHVLPRALRFAAPLLLGEESPLPALVELRACNTCLDKLDFWVSKDRTEKKTECVKMWLAELRILFPNLPESFDIPSCADRWMALDPMAELEGMIGKEKIIAATPETPIEDIAEQIKAKNHD
jgi:hypothetical protein